MTILDSTWTWSGASSSLSASSSTSVSTATATPSSPKTIRQSSSSSRPDASCSRATITYTSKSDAFFASATAMVPLKPPSPIVSRRASDSCLPPPCAASLALAPVATTLVSGAKRDRWSSLPDIHDPTASDAKKHVNNAGLGIRSPPLYGANAVSAIASSSSSSSCYSSAPSSSSSSANPSPTLLRSRSPSALARSARARTDGLTAPQEEGEESLDARLQAAIQGLTSRARSSFDRGNGRLWSTQTAHAQQEEEEEDNMYNDVPSSSSSSAASGSTLRSRSAFSSRSSRRQEKEQQRSVFEDDDDDDEDDGGGEENGQTTGTIQIRLHRTSTNDDGDDDDDDDKEPFQPCYPLSPLEVIYKPLHRIRRNRSLRRAMSDSCANGALQSHTHTQAISSQPVKRKGALRRPLLDGTTTSEQQEEGEKRRVSFLNEVQVVDVFAAIDYPARRGPPPLERLTMRDVLELRQIKLELAAYMGEEMPSPEPVITNSSKQDALSTAEKLEEEACIESSPTFPTSHPLEQSLSATSSTSNTSISVSTSSSAAPLSLGSGLEVDLHSLIAPFPSSVTLASSSEEEAEAQDSRTERQSQREESPDSTSSSSSSSSSLPPSLTSSIATSTSATSNSNSSGCSSPTSSSSYNLPTSLSCSPATPDSEFNDSIESCDEFGQSRRGSEASSLASSVSCEYSRQAPQHKEPVRVQEEFKDEQEGCNSQDSAKTPTKLSSLFKSGPFAPNNTRRGRSDEMDCIKIALPVLTADDGYIRECFDEATIPHHDPWSAPTY